MFRPDKLAVIATTAALTFAGCGGGGSAPSPAAVQHTTTAPQARTPIASGTLSITLPPRIVKAQNVARAGVKGARAPQFVNPSPGMVLDIYVDTLLASNLDGVAGANDSLNITESPSGSQTATLPLYSTSDNVVAIEWDSSSHNTVVAIGTVATNGVTPGSTNNITLTMQMNAQYIVASDNADGSGQSQAQVGFSNEFGTPGAQLAVGPIDCTSTLNPPSQNTFYAFQADTTQSFVPIAGFAGTSPVSIQPVAFFSGSTTVIQISPGAYNVAFDAALDPTDVELIASNPAWPVAQSQAVQAVASNNGLNLSTISLSQLDVFLELAINQAC